MDKVRPTLQLSEREGQLIKLASEGHTDTSISHRLGISEATVGTYWGRIRVKLGPYSRTELVALVLRAEQAAALSELRQVNAELALKVETAVSDDEGFYRELIDNAADAILLTSESGTITSANRASYELFGYSPGELLGRHISVLLPDRFRADHEVHTRTYVFGPSKRTMGGHAGTPALRKDGSEIAIQATLSAVTTPTGLVVMCAHRLLPENFGGLWRPGAEAGV